MDHTHGPGRRHTRNGNPMIAAEWDDPAMPALAWWRRDQPHTQISGGPDRVSNEPQEGATRRYVGFVDPAPKPDDDTAGAPNTIPGVW